MSQKILIITVPVLMPDNPPYGAAVVSGILNNYGYSSEVWDLNIDLYKQYQSQWHTVVDLLGTRGYRPDPVHKLNMPSLLKVINRMIKEKLQAIDPEFVLLSVFSSQSLDMVIPLSVMIKKLHPRCYLLAGGRGLDNTERMTKTNYADFYSKYLPVDCWYLGDAENNLITVIEQRIKGVYRSAPVTKEQIEKVPPASWQGYNFERYRGHDSNNLRLPITGSKGCVRDCTFCDVGASWPKYIYRKGADIGKEIVDVYRSTGIQRFEFTDNLVNGSITNFRAMNQYIVNNQPDTLDYIGYAICRPKNEFPAEDFQSARCAGASLFKVGIESGSERVRFDMKKKFSNPDITWFAENCHDNGIKQLWLMFVGYPTETEQDFQDTINLLKDHRHLATNGMIEVYLSLPMQLTSGSAFMRKYSEAYGLMHDAHDPWQDFFWVSTRYQDNTFEVRLERWRRMLEAVDHYGYFNSGARQAEKLLDIQGVEKIYREHYTNGKRIIPIHQDTTHINKETYV